MNRGEAGFTLIETIVALTVLGLVMLGAVQGLRFGIAGWRTQSRHIGSVAELDGVDRVLRTLFHGIDGTAANQIHGTAHAFSFTGYLPAIVPGTLRLAEMTLIVTPDRRLVLRWRPHRHAVESARPATIDIELVRHVRDIRFSYSQGGDTEEWQSAIDGAVPALVRVQIVGEKGDPRHWPVLIAAPVVTSP